MLIEVVEYKEDEDGGATVTLDLDEAGKEFLIERGFNSLIRDAIDKMKAESDLGEMVRMAQEDGDYDTEWWDHYCKSQDDVMSFQKGNVCDWCGISEEVARKNREHVEKMKAYEEWKKDESSSN